jgi:hypothetical protein
VLWYPSEYGVHKNSHNMHPLIDSLFKCFQGRASYDVTQDFVTTFSLAGGSLGARFFTGKAATLGADIIATIVGMMKENEGNQLSPTYLYVFLRYICN